MAKLTTFKPLPLVDWSGVGEPIAAGINWPPTAIQDRLRRLQLYWELFHGDFTNLTKYNSVSINMFQRVVVAIADLLTSERPVSGLGDDFDSELADVVYDAIVDMLRYGGCLLFQGPDPKEPETRDGKLEVLDPRYWSPTTDGWAYVVPIPDPKSGHISTAEVMEYSGDILSVTIQEFTGGSTTMFNQGSFGSVLETKTMVRMEDPLHKVIRKPKVLGWGTSMFDSLAPLMAEFMRRLTITSRALDKQAIPQMTYRIADLDRGVFVPNHDPDSPWDEQSEQIDEAIDDFYDFDRTVLPDAVQDYGAVVWDLKADSAFEMAEKMESYTETATGTAGLFRGLEAAASGGLSGVAVKRMLMTLYNTTAATQEPLKLEIEIIIGSKLDWRHAFDVLAEADREEVSPSGGGDGEPA